MLLENDLLTTIQWVVLILTRILLTSDFHLHYHYRRCPSADAQFWRDYTPMDVSFSIANGITDANQQHAMTDWYFDASVLQHYVKNVDTVIVAVGFEPRFSVKNFFSSTRYPFLEAGVLDLNDLYAQIINHIRPYHIDFLSPGIHLSDVFAAAIRSNALDSMHHETAQNKQYVHDVQTFLALATAAFIASLRAWPDTRWASSMSLTDFIHAVLADATHMLNAFIVHRYSTLCTLPAARVAFDEIVFLVYL